MGDAAQRNARVPYRASLNFETGGDGDESERIGERIPDLQIAVVGREALWRQLDGNDDFVAGKIGVDLRRVSRETMKLGEWNRAIAFAPLT